MNLSDRNKRTAVIVLGVVALMVGMSYAAVPAYRAFCQITGFDGSVRQAEFAPGTILEREMTVRFDATVTKGLPWRFRPEQLSQTLPIGSTGLAYFEAVNLSDAPVIGTATFNVQPAKAGVYFRKIECFCFSEQMLMPGEKMSMPVTYFIDPAIHNDRNLDDVNTITLSYSFYRNEEAEAEQLAALKDGQKEDS